MGSQREEFQNVAIPGSTPAAASAPKEEEGDLTLAIKSAEEAAKKATEAVNYMKKVGETLKKEAEGKS